MKTIYVLMAVVMLAIGFTACNNPKADAKKDADNVIVYVDSVKNLTPVYTNAYWAELDMRYRDMVRKSDSTAASLAAEDKARLEESKAAYAALKASYESNIKLAESKATGSATDFRQALRNRLFGEGVIGSDMSFAFANAGNLLSIYQRFVDEVDRNKKNYSREDWDEIKVLYEALDTRKNTVEKDLPKGDNNKIAALKVKFSAIKSMYRGGTKGEENKAAKEKAN